VSHPLVLDEMLSDNIASELRARGHDVIALVADPSLVGLPDDEVLATAAEMGRALVTLNIKDFAPLDQRWKAAGRGHAGLVLMSSKTFAQDRGFAGAVIAALDRPFATEVIRADAVVFLPR